MLLGYPDRLSVAPGELIAFMVSSEAPEYDAEMVRLRCGDDRPEAPGLKEEVVRTSARGRRRGRPQPISIGSRIVVEGDVGWAALDAFTLTAFIQPTALGGHPQAVMGAFSAAADAGVGLFVEADGHLCLRLGAGTGVRAVAPLAPSQWCFVAGGRDGHGSARVHVLALPPAPLRERAHERAAAVAHMPPPPADTPFSIAAASGEGGRPAAPFDGKIEAPALFARLLERSELDALSGGASPTAVAGESLVAHWDLALEAHSTRAVDVGPHGLHGRVLNGPTRAVTGHAWTGAEIDFRRAPAHYGAIHFHRDDLDDCGWDEDFELKVPDGLRSGVYAARLRAGGEEDHVPFFVRPPAGTVTAPVCFLAPTFTYLAYANSHHQLRLDYRAQGITDREIAHHPLEEHLREHPEFGLSLYDLHADGSGCAYSSRLRPILTMRPRFRMAVQGVRHLAADLWLVDWLDQKDVRYDVVTDEDLHREGAQLLERYRCVLTGSHPEYCTAPMLDGLEGYLGDGGRLMYLGGNGFYWVTSVDPARPHVIEVRRGAAGTRAWSSAPGEGHHASTGEPGGLWRHRGRAPNRLVGVGFSAQGWDRRAPGYRRRPDSFDERAAFIFEGIGPDEEIGAFGLAVGGGAAGDEVDRIDVALGSPAHALRLASSEGHSRFYQLVVEEMAVTQAHHDGETHPDVRADMAYFETPNGGAVFSVGSINWCGSFAHNGYDNNVSRITENVLRRFTAAEREAT